MGEILKFVQDDEGGTFGPSDITAMSRALDDVCSALNIGTNTTAREVIAMRIIEWARRGERSHAKLRDSVLAEANGGSGC